ncbi:MAG: hypothetical protein AAF841_06330, partial [Pseudomonadota bacterium]
MHSVVVLSLQPSYSHRTPSAGADGAQKQEDNVLSLSSDAAQAADAGARMIAKPQEMSEATRALITQTLSEEKAEDIVEIDLR